MNNISDFVPLIIIVASLVYSFVKNTNKAKQAEMAKTTLPGKREIRLPQQSVVPKSPVLQVENKQKQANKANTSTIETPYFVKDSRKEFTSSMEPAYVSAKEEGSPTPIISIDDTDELKKAFIYMEILQRKEY